MKTQPIVNETDKRGEGKTAKALDLPMHPVRNAAETLSEGIGKRIDELIKLKAQVDAFGREFITPTAARTWEWPQLAPQSACPKCGVQIYDPFDGTRLIHDVLSCGGFKPLVRTACEDADPVHTQPAVKKAKAKRRKGAAAPSSESNSGKGAQVRGRILELLTQHGSMKPSEISLAIGKAIDTTSYHLRLLLRADKVEVNGAGNRTSYRLTGEAAPASPTVSPVAPPAPAAPPTPAKPRRKTVKERFEELLPTLQGEFHAGMMAEAIMPPNADPHAARQYTESAAAMLTQWKTYGLVERGETREGKVWYRKPA